MECSSLTNLIAVLLVVGVAVASPGGGSVIAKAGCQAECGGVQIPFPFGIGEGCYLKSNQIETYEVKCNETADPPIAHLPWLLIDPFSNSTVQSINLDDHSLRAFSGVAYDCYNNTYTNVFTSNKLYLFINSYLFSVSTTENRLVGIGCDTMAWLEELSDSQLYDGDGSCTTSCGSRDDFASGICSGFGCCETSFSIFDNENQISVSVNSLNNHSLEGEQGCNYAFIAEVGSYKLALDNLTASDQDCRNIRVPVVYDWHIASSQNCLKLGTTALVCGSNTVCVDVKSGYHCRCLQGYTGNAYLPHGCQDINECADKRLNDCETPELCVNKNGGYDCTCKAGHHGNGTITSPCIPDSGSTNLIRGLAIGMGSTIGFIILYVAYNLFKRRKHIQERQRNFRKNGGLLLHQELSTNEGVIDRTKIFTQSDLERATDNFNSTRVLGHGGQGTVYKGMLAEGTIVAVKKSKKVDANQVAQFINEVVILSQINHRNIVKLFGCCLETEVPLLVYEFVPNGTLYQHIHHPSEDFHMTWEVRFQIAMECAGAVEFFSYSPQGHQVFQHTFG